MGGRFLLACLMCILSIVHDTINVTAESKTKTKKKRPPHIIFILADDLGWNDIGYHATANSMIQTPFLDRMADHGVKLENYYVQPVCSPTRSQLMTGRYQIRMGIQHINFSPGDNVCLPLNETLLPEVLRKQGYVTHAIGKWHLGMAKRACLPTRRGFDSFFGVILGTSDHFTYQRSLTINKTVSMGNAFYENENATSAYRGQFSAELYTQRAIEIIRKHKKKKPLFLYLPFQMVHEPDPIPPKYVKGLKRKIRNKDRRHYVGRVAALDQAVKNITKALTIHGLYDNSVIVFSTDNGGSVRHMANNWPLRGGKGRLWEGGVRAIGFVHSPLLPKKVRGTSYHGLMHVSDWLPTLVRGVAKGSLKSVKKPLDGYNVWNNIKRSKPSPRVVLLHNINPAKGTRKWRSHDENNWGKLEKLPFNATIRAAIRVGDWKLMTGGPGTGRRYLPPENRAKMKVFAYDDRDSIRLYNIRRDPSELKNVALKYPERVIKMLRKLRHFNDISAEPLKYELDVRSNPVLFNGVWTPWLDD